MRVLRTRPSDADQSLQNVYTGKFKILVVRNTDLLIVLLVRMAVSPATFGQNTDVGNRQVCTNTDVGKIRSINQNTDVATNFKILTWALLM